MYWLISLLSIYFHFFLSIFCKYHMIFLPHLSIWCRNSTHIYQLWCICSKFPILFHTCIILVLFLFFWHFLAYIALINSLVFLPLQFCYFKLPLLTDIWKPYFLNYIQELKQLLPNQNMRPSLSEIVLEFLSILTSFLPPTSTPKPGKNEKVLAKSLTQSHDRVRDPFIFLTFRD